MYPGQPNLNALLSSVHQTARTMNGRPLIVVPEITEYDPSLLVVMAWNAPTFNTSQRLLATLSRNLHASASHVLRMRKMSIVTASLETFLYSMAILPEDGV